MASPNLEDLLLEDEGDDIVFPKDVVEEYIINFSSALWVVFSQINLFALRL